DEPVDVGELEAEPAADSSGAHVRLLAKQALQFVPRPGGHELECTAVTGDVDLRLDHRPPTPSTALSCARIKPNADMKARRVSSSSCASRVAHWSGAVAPSRSTTPRTNWSKATARPLRLFRFAMSIASSMSSSAWSGARPIISYAFSNICDVS